MIIIDKLNVYYIIYNTNVTLVISCALLQCKIDSIKFNVIDFN